MTEANDQAGTCQPENAPRVSVLEKQQQLLVEQRDDLVTQLDARKQELLVVYSHLNTSRSAGELDSLRTELSRSVGKLSLLETALTNVNGSGRGMARDDSFGSLATETASSCNRANEDEGSVKDNTAPLHGNTSLTSKVDELWDATRSDDTARNGAYAGCTFDANGNIVDSNGRVVTRSDALKGLPPGCAIDAIGRVIDKDGNCILDVAERLGDTSRAVTDAARNGAYVGCTLNADGNIIDSNGRVVGHSDALKGLPPGCTIDASGRVVDKDGKVILDVAERLGATSNAVLDATINGAYVGCTLDAEGNIIDSNGHVVAHSDALKGLPPGCTVDASGRVVDKDGNVILDIAERLDTTRSTAVPLGASLNDVSSTCDEACQTPETWNTKQVLKKK